MSNQESFPDREDFSSEHQQVLGNNEPLFRFSNQENSIRSFFEEHRDYMLAEAKSEVRKHPSRADHLDTSVRGLQRQLDSKRLEIYCTNQGYEETRKEQARLHEELAQREKALRDSRFRNIHEMEELKSAQEMRVDEFSIHKLKETHATIQKLTSQRQELQEKMNCDSKAFQDIESICSGKLSHVPSQPAVVPSLRSMLSRDHSLQPDTWNLSGTQGNVLWQSTCYACFITDTLSRKSSLYES